MTIRVCYNRDKDYDERFSSLEDVEIYDIEVIEKIKTDTHSSYGGYLSVKRNIMYYLSGRMDLPTNSIIRAWYLDENEEWREIFDFRKLWKY